MSNEELPTFESRPLERSQPVDLTVLGIGITVFAVDLVAYLYILANRNYSPLKAKNIPVMGLALLSALFWWMGDSQVSGLFGEVNGILRLCLMWGLWMRHVLGIMTHLIIINYRLHVLNWVFNKRCGARGWRFYLPVCLMAIPPLALCIISAALPYRYTLEYNAEEQRCKHNSFFKFFAFGYSVVLIMCIWIQSFILRNIKSSFNEFRQILPACVGATVIVTLNALFVITGFHHAIVGRAILSIANLIACQLFFWCIMGPPIWGSLFHRQAYLTRFYSSLQRDGLRQSVGPSPPLSSAQSTFPSSRISEAEKRRGISQAGTASTCATLTGHASISPPRVYGHSPDSPELPASRPRPLPLHPEPWALASQGHHYYHHSESGVQIVPISPASDAFHHDDPQDMFIIIPTQHYQQP
ncbi:hypothetical protein IWQ60_001422 [Tieghemiomyces parasiticus]|uniref:Transmembrane protein n=1 Tax=Tieghemiomyces parasiticus TaxID=78921 RepID=A0A9W8AE89_9FUNG|nr:hypothetical protein IWQ60_001422 [Tieghemiomyces parasiticus]